MDRELEALLFAYDAWLQAGPEAAPPAQIAFERYLDEVSAQRRDLTKEKLLKALQAYYPRWVRAQWHPPTMPPKA
jgi:hypothetical protein